MSTRAEIAEAYEHDYQLLCDLLPEQFLGDDEPNE